MQNFKKNEERKAGLRMEWFAFKIQSVQDAPAAFKLLILSKHTPPKFNVETENEGAQKGISFSRELFICKFHVKFLGV